MLGYKTEAGQTIFKGPAFLDLGRGICYSTSKCKYLTCGQTTKKHEPLHLAAVPCLSDSWGIIRTPDASLTNNVIRLFPNHGVKSVYTLYPDDMTEEFAAQQPASDPTVDAWWLFNLFT